MKTTILLFTAFLSGMAAPITALFESDYLVGGSAICYFDANPGERTATCTGEFSQHGPTFAGVGANRPMRVDLYDFIGDTPTIPPDLWQRVVDFGDAGFWGMNPHTPFEFSYTMYVDGASRDLYRFGTALLYWHEGVIRLNLWAHGVTLSGRQGSSFVPTGDWRYTDPSLPLENPVPEPGTFLVMGVGLVGLRLFRSRRS